MQFVQQFFDAASEFVHDHWLKALFAPAMFVLAAWWTLWLAKRQLRQRAFLGRVNASLNMLEPQGNIIGKLLIRTMFEVNISDIFLGNKAAVNMVLAAAKKTTREQPFLLIPNKEDEWLALNSILNEISERCADGLIAKVIGLPTKRAKFLFGMTCEKDADVRIRKVRIMIISEETLRKIYELHIAPRDSDNVSPQEPAYESPTHHTRWRTLNKMARLHFEEKSPAIMAVEIVRPV